LYPTWWVRTSDRSRRDRFCRTETTPERGLPFGLRFCRWSPHL